MFSNYIRGKTETNDGEKRHSKHRERTMYVNESFNNIKTVKLFGWEPDFLKKVDEVYQEELKLEDKAHARSKIYEIVDHFLNNIMSLTTFSVYIWFGGSLTLSKVTLTEIMLDRIRGRIGHTQHLYREYFNVMESMEKLWNFYCAPEYQKGLINKRQAEDIETDKCEHAFSIKGNFSYGITPKLDQADKDKAREKIKKKEYK